MDVKRSKKPKSRRQRLRQAVKGGPFRLRKKVPAEVAGPPDGDATPRNKNAGILRFEAQKWRLPEALAEAGETEREGLAPGRVVIVIATLAILFIAIIAWFVSQMPNK